MAIGLEKFVPPKVFNSEPDLKEFIVSCCEEKGLPTLHAGSHPFPEVGRVLEVNSQGEGVLRGLDGEGEATVIGPSTNVVAIGVEVPAMSLWVVYGLAAYFPKPNPRLGS